MRVEGLEALVAVAKHRSFRHAASELGVTQAAVTQRIQRLEGSTGLLLFTRTSRRVELTSDGEALLPAAREAVGALARAERRARELAVNDRPVLRIGTSFGVDESLQSLLRGLRARHPGLRPELHRLHTPAKLEALRSGTLDLAFVHEPLLPAGIDAVQVYAEPLVLVTGRPHAPATREVALAALAGRPLLVPPAGWNPGVRVRLAEICTAAGLEPPMEEYHDVADALSLIATSDAWMLMLRSSAQQLTQPGLSTRELVELPTVAVLLAWSATRAPDALIADAVAVVRRLHASLGRR